MSPPRGRPLAIVHRRPQRLKGRGVDPRGGEAPAQRLQMRHHLEHLDHARGAELAHEDAASRQLLDQAGGGQRQQRLAHRRARGVEPLGQPHLVEPLALAELALHDRLLERLADAVGRLHRSILMVMTYHATILVYKT